LSTGSRDLFESGDVMGYVGDASGAGWRLPDKLRIVKPLEGSLTLHNWQQLAMPSLGGIFEERRGIAFRGGLDHFSSSQKNLSKMMNMSENERGLYRQKPQDFCEEESTFGKEGKKLRKRDEATYTNNTFTDSMVLHPEKAAKVPGAAETVLTSSFSGRTQMSCGFPSKSTYGGDSGAESSLASSRFSSRYASNTSLNSSMAAGAAPYRNPMQGRPQGRISSQRSSVLSETGRPSRQGTSLAYSSNIGLARLLDSRDRRGLAGSVTNLDKLTLTGGDARDRSPFITREMASNVQKLTPSVLSSPKGLESFSPPGTPLNSPSRSRDPSVDRSGRHRERGASAKASAAAAAAATLPQRPQDQRPEDQGLVYSFFSSLKSALYGEQEREAKTIIKHRTKQLTRKGSKKFPKKFGILAKVEEVGVENLMSGGSGRASGYDSDSSTDQSLASSSYYMSGSKTYHDLKSNNRRSGGDDFYDFSSSNEFEDIVPGSLTVMSTDERGDAVRGQMNSTIGQLTAPFFSMFGRPSLNRSDLGSVPVVSSAGVQDGVGGGPPGMMMMGGRGPGKVMSGPGEKRPMVYTQFGVPGVPGTGDLERSIRPDLGQVPMSSNVSGGHHMPYHHPDLTTNPYGGATGDSPYGATAGSGGDQSSQPGFVGSIGSLFFGRKGGLL